jgi:hypothetical protein
MVCCQQRVHVQHPALHLLLLMCLQQQHRHHPAAAAHSLLLLVVRLLQRMLLPLPLTQQQLQQWLPLCLLWLL